MNNKDMVMRESFKDKRSGSIKFICYYGRINPKSESVFFPFFP